MPFGDVLDLRNSYVKGVDIDIENYAVNQFRKQEGLEKPGFLKRLWSKVKRNPSTPTTEEEENKMEKENVVGIPNPFIECENRVKEYMESTAQGSYDAFMQEPTSALPESLERFVNWGHNPYAKTKWFTSYKQFSKKAKELDDLVSAHLGPQFKSEMRELQAAYELEIAGETKYVVDVRQQIMQDYREAHDIEDGMFTPAVMVNVVKEHKLIIDAESGKVEDSYSKKHATNHDGPIIGLPKPVEYGKQSLAA
jgi:hypothetical protein